MPGKRARKTSRRRRLSGGRPRVIPEAKRPPVNSVPSTAFMELDDSKDNIENLRRLNHNLQQNRRLLRNVLGLLHDTKAVVPMDTDEIRAVMREVVLKHVRGSFSSAAVLDKFVNATKKDVRDYMWDEKLSPRCKIVCHENAGHKKYMLSRLHNRCARLWPWLILFYKNAKGAC
jgi:hypothetical protein